MKSPISRGYHEVLTILIFCQSVYIDTSLLIYVVIISVHTQTKLKPSKGPGTNAVREKNLPANVGNRIREE